VIEKLEDIRDRILAVFNSSINGLEPDPREAPDPRPQQLEQQRKEIKRLLAELRQSHQQLRHEIEDADFSPLYDRISEDAS